MVSCVDCYIGTAKNLERLCLFAHCFAIPRLCVSCVCGVACSAAAALRLVLVGAVPGQQVAFPVFICFILLSKP